MVIDIMFRALAIFMGLIVPGYAFITAKKTQQYVLDNPNAKAGLYRQAGVFQLLVVTIIALLFVIQQQPIAHLGLSFDYPLLQIVLLFLIPTAVIGFLWAIPFGERSQRLVNKMYGEVMFLLPKTRAEFKWSLILSVCVGICEEVIYRGFLVWQAIQFMPEFYAIVLVNAFFAVNHAATKLKNSLGAFFCGIFLSITYVMTGDLWLAMLLHITVDAMAMVLSYRYQTIDNTLT